MLMSVEYDRLYRSRTNRKVLGVCGGLGEYFGVDPTIPRIIFVVLGALSLGTWLLIYLIMAFIIPEEPEEFLDTMADTPPSGIEPAAEETEAGESPAE
jgi:phage shock protein C